MTEQADVVAELSRRNQSFASSGYDAGLKIMPSLKTLVIGCVDPRVDPAAVLGLKNGEAAILRNVGGRVTPDTLHTLTMLQLLGTGTLRAGWNIILLHHTDCGILRMQGTELLAKYFDVPLANLEAFHVGDPRASVAFDVAALKAAPNLAGATITGLVYDVATGRVS